MWEKLFYLKDKSLFYLQKLPFFDIILLFFNGLKNGDLPMRASYIAYSFFLALFPTVLFFFTLIPYFPIENIDVVLLGSLENFLPGHVFETVKSTVEDIVSRPRSGLMSIGFIMSFYFATNGIASIIEGFHASVYEMETRSWLRQRLVAFFLLIVIAILIILSIVLMSINSTVLNWFMEWGIIKSSFSYYMVVFAKWFILIALIYFIYAFIYYFGPAKRKMWRFFSHGSSLATILTLLATIGFNIYISNFATYNALYGSIGTLIIILLWIYLNAMVLLLGFELNISITHHKLNK